MSRENLKSRRLSEGQGLTTLRIDNRIAKHILSGYEYGRIGKGNRKGIYETVDQQV